MEADARRHPRDSDEAIWKEEPAWKLPCPDNGIPYPRVLESSKGEQVSDHGSDVVQGDFPPVRTYPKEVIEERLNRQSLWLAQLALKLYNEREEAVDHQLELINPISGKVFWRRYFWYHMNFIARPKGSSENKGRCYFAEIQHTCPDFLIAFCPVETEGVSEDEMINGCRGCCVRHRIYHPPSDKFEVGRPPRYGCDPVYSRGRPPLIIRF